MIVNMKKLLMDAKNNHYAIPQFNINNLEWTKYILEECNKNNSPVILGVTEGAIKYMGGYSVVSNLVYSLVDNLGIHIPVVIHLDHGSSFESCKKAIDAKFTSVMIDASNCDLDSNIRETKKVVEYAHIKDVSVEAEIGKVGGNEDGIKSHINYADIKDCIKLAHNAEIDCLAPAVGNVHGIYKGEPNINFLLINEISKKVNIPLGLHGGSGLSDEIIKQTIKNGINKVNINTELQIAWSNAIRKYLKENPNKYDPREIIKSGEFELKKIVKNKLILFDSINRSQTQK